jgi:spermidine/putrescine transport system ATP-binding protein
MALSDRLAVMTEGRIAQIGRPVEIYQQPSTRFVADFIGQMNFLPADIVARDGAAARVRIDGYECVAENPASLTGRATMAVRPEDMRIGAAPGLPARIEVRNFLGNLVEFKARLGAGATVRVQAPPSATFEEGAPVTVAPEGDPVRMKIAASTSTTRTGADRGGRFIGDPAQMR